MPTTTDRSPTPGRSLVTRRPCVDLVRTATLGSYGVSGLPAAGRSAARRSARHRTHAASGVELGGELAIELDLTVAHGLPIAEVARQVDSAVRYAIRQRPRSRASPA